MRPEPTRTFIQVQIIVKFRGFSQLFIGRCVVAISQWTILVVMARWGSATAVGEYGIAAAITSPIFMLFRLRLGEVVATDVRDRNDAATIALVSALLSVIATVVAILLSAIIGYKDVVLLSIACLSLGKTFESISEIAHGIKLRRGQSRNVAISYALQGILTIGGFSIALYTYQTLYAGLAGVAAGYLATLLIYDLRLIEWRESNAYTREYLKETLALLRESWHLGYLSMLSSICTNIPRYALEAAGLRQAVGIYTALYGSVAPIRLINEAYGRASISSYVNSYISGPDEFRGMSRDLVRTSSLIAILAIIFVVLLGEKAILLIYGDSFADHANVLLLCVVAAAGGMINSHLKRALIIMRQIKIQIFAVLSSLLISSVIGYVSIPVLGIIGAGLSIIGVTWSEMFITMVTLKMALGWSLQK